MTNQDLDLVCESASAGEILDALLAAAEEAPAPAPRDVPLQGVFYPSPGIVTGLGQFDRLGGGLQPGQLTVLAARPFAGKYPLALQWLAQVGVEQGLPVQLISFDLPLKALAAQLLSAHSGFALADLKADAAPAVQAAMRVSQAKIAAANIRLVRIDGDQSDLLFDLARQFHEECNQTPGLLVIADFQGFALAHVESPYPLLRRLKALARKLELPLLLLSELDWNEGTDFSTRPKLSDLPEQALAVVADQIWLLHRPDDPETGVPSNEGELIVAKSREGITGSYDLIFNGQRFSEGWRCTRTSPFFGR